MNQISQILPFVLRLETSKNLTSYKFRIVLFNVQLYLILNVNIVDYKFFFNLSLLIYRKNRMIVPFIRLWKHQHLTVSWVTYIIGFLRKHIIILSYFKNLQCWKERIGKLSFNTSSFAAGMRNPCDSRIRCCTRVSNRLGRLLKPHARGPEGPPPR